MGDGSVVGWRARGRELKAAEQSAEPSTRRRWLASRGGGQLVLLAVDADWLGRTRVHRECTVVVLMQDALL